MRLALFDLDYTLLDGDCSALWNDWMVECGWADSPGVYLARTQAMNAAYHAGRLKLEQYLAVTLSPLAGRHDARHGVGQQREQADQPPEVFRGEAAGEGAGKDGGQASFMTDSIAVFPIAWGLTIAFR